jgi:hypothetical protein
LNILKKANKWGWGFASTPEWNDSQDGGVMKGEIPQELRVLNRTTKTLLENRCRTLCTLLSNKAIQSIVQWGLNLSR